MNTHTSSESKRILIVDDESVNRKMLHMFLQKIDNVHIVEANGGQEAVDKAQNDPPDLILMDIMMPGMDGLEACRHIKQMEATQDIPVIFLSALDDAQSKNLGFSAGGIDYVSKPFEAQELKSRVMSHLALKEQTDFLQGRSSRLEQEVQKRTLELEESQKELSRNYAYLQSINELLYLTLKEFSLDMILDQALATVLGNSCLAAAQCGWIFLYRPQTGSFELAAHRNPNQVPTPVCSMFADQSYTCSFPEEDLQDQILLSPADDQTGYRCSQCPQDTCCVPFYFGEQMLGLVVIRLRSGHVLTSGENHFLNSIARALAGILVRKNTTQALQESENLYRAIFETTQNATCIVEEDGRIGLANSAFSSLSGLDRDDIEGVKLWKDFVYAQDRDRVAEYRRLRLQGQHAPNSYEFRFVNKEGETKHVLSTVDQIPGAKRIVVSLLDITEQKHFEAELERQALYDTLTGLPNRSLFRTIVSRLIAPGNEQRSKSFALLFLDLDRFSLLNESLGHQAGDNLLKQAAQRLRKAVSSKETVCRFSSDEFIILIEHIQDYSEVIIQAEKFRNLMNETFVLGEQEVHTTCCIGIAMPEDSAQHMQADDVIRNAEMAMHRAKLEGLNSIKAFSPVMHEQTTRFLDIERDLHQALKRDEFVVFYQPIIELHGLNLVGFEGLVRWIHPQQGLVSPDQFIPVAEETDLIIPIGNRVLEMACQEFANWLHKSADLDMFISINLSAKQFKQKDLLGTISKAIDQTRIPPNNLKLEITESVIMSDVHTSSTILNQMKEMGIQLAIDDFGTGYSSLSYLQSLPINYIKIDRSFVWGMGNNAQNIELIKAIVAMGHNLEHILIAEGIETLPHLQMLRDLGCDLGQGFYFAKPMPANDVRTYITAYEPGSYCHDPGNQQ
ncbi:MAG: EAL domain-containing protein [Desulfovermiculus sp.]